MRKILILSVLITISLTAATAQNDAEERYRQAVKEAFSSYEKFRSQAENSYNEFRQKANAEYAAFLEQSWESFKVSPAQPKPTPDPPVQPSLPKEELEDLGMEDDISNALPQREVKPVAKPQQDNSKKVVKPTATPQPIELDYGKVVTRPTVQPQPQPKVPVEEPKVLTHKDLRFNYFGDALTVRTDAVARPMHVSSSEESSIAAAWREASDGRYDLMLGDCLKLRKELELCDWGYYMLVRAVTKAHYGDDSSNDAKLLQAYLLTQSGYKLRLARSGGKIFIMLPSQQTVYTRYVTIDSERFYFMDDDFKGGSFYVSKAAFDGEQGFSLIITKHPKLSKRNETCNTYKARRFGTSVEYCPNKNLVDFYNSYPHCDWQIYANAKLSDEAKAAIYPTLRQAIAGKTEAQSANILIDFVQTAFDYKTDGEQFGGERSLFCEETFYYPFSDCEDRAILFTTLVRDLLGLKTALLYYPGHLASAVEFNENVSGDYLTIEGKRYTVCDPTYIGASIGMTMPKMKDKKVEVTLL